MIEALTLEELGERIEKVDRHLVDTLAVRLKLALQVEKIKRQKGEDIYNRQREEIRLEAIQAWAKAAGLNPHFTHALLYLVIDESCKAQLIQFQEVQRKTRQQSEEQRGDDQFQSKEIHYQNLKRNLLLLTEKIAPTYDERYHKSFFATESYLTFEKAMVSREIVRLEEHGLALDLGCATGRQAFKLAQNFDQVIGYDLSPAMIEQARSNHEMRVLKHISFEVADLEEGIPQADSSVSFLVMNLGTASDLRNIAKVLQEAERVLKPNGRFLFSFYNYDALVYRWPVLPWPASLAAVVNVVDHCLDVSCEGTVFSVFALPYITKRVQGLFPQGLSVSQLFTYPTISPILPNDVLRESEEIQEVIAAIDERLADGAGGAYIIATGRKLS